MAGHFLVSGSASPSYRESDLRAAAGLGGTRRRRSQRRRLELDDHRLGLEVAGEDFLAHLAAPAALLEAAERQLCAEHVVGIDPYRARLDAPGELMGLR